MAENVVVRPLATTVLLVEVLAVWNVSAAAEPWITRVLLLPDWYRP